MYNVARDNDEERGQLLIGETGRMGYHVTVADRKYNVMMRARYLDDNYPRSLIWVHKSYMVLMRIDELICIETNLNAVSPIHFTERESKKTSWWNWGLSWPSASYQAT